MHPNHSHEHLNPLSDFSIGKVVSCISISQSSSLSKIVLVCGTKIYVILITLYPSLSISKDIRSHTRDFVLESYNANSKQRIGLTYDSTIIDLKIKSWVVMTIFILIILTVSWLVYQIQYTTSKKQKKKEEGGLRIKFLTYLMCQVCCLNVLYRDRDSLQRNKEGNASYLNDNWNKSKLKM